MKTESKILILLLCVIIIQLFGVLFYLKRLPRYFAREPYFPTYSIEEKLDNIRWGIAGLSDTIEETGGFIEDAVNNLQP